jgi:aspartyl-tRNA(Asn)/glutamyl-tRNA(Gln) amidotransferase subunit B
MKTDELEKLCKGVLEAYPDKVNNYKLGNPALIGLFAGEVMKRCKGEADPKETLSILIMLLEK